MSGQLASNVWQAYPFGQIRSPQASSARAVVLTKSGAAKLSRKAPGATNERGNLIAWKLLGPV
jgi:hypothetical protein